MNIQTKQCTKCGAKKQISEFSKEGLGKYGVRGDCKVCRKQYREDNKNRIRERHKKYYKKNKELLNKKSREYAKNNREKINAYIRRRKEMDKNFKLFSVLRDRIKKAIKNAYGEKAYSSKELLGVDIETVREHLESQFTEGMSWDNYGKWHIDHIRPCTSFDLTDTKQQKECFHYTNLQPLWAEDNFRKRDKI